MEKYYVYVDKKVKSDRIYELKNPIIEPSIFNSYDVSVDCKFINKNSFL